MAVLNDEIWLEDSRALLYIDTRNGRGRWMYDSLPPGNFLWHADISGIVAFDDRNLFITATTMRERTDRTDSGMYDNRIARTSDGGRSWHIHPLQVRTSIHAACGNDDGSAWIAGEEGVIFYSDDFGGSWSHISTADRLGAISAIDIGADGFGMAGGFDNRIAVTRDGGRSWRLVPTPLDQSAYRSRNRDRGHIWDVAPWQGYLLARQSGRCFYTGSDSISWKPLPAGAGGFAVGRDGSLLLIDSSNQVLRLEEPLSEGNVLGRMKTYPVAMAAGSTRTCMIDAAGGIYSLEQDELRYIPPPSDDRTATTPDMELVRPYGGVLFGARNSTIYRSHDTGRSWCRYGTAHGDIRNIIPADGDRLILFHQRLAGASAMEGGEITDAIDELEGLYIERIVDRGDVLVACGARARWSVEDPLVYGARATGSALLLVSFDRGVSWHRAAEAPGEFALGVALNYDNTLLFLSSRTIRKLRITGRTVEAVESFPVENMLDAFDAEIAMFCDSVGYARINRGAHDRFVATRDGGRTWTATDFRTFPFISSLPFQSGIICIARDQQKLIVSRGGCDSSVIFDAGSLGDENTLYRIYGLAHDTDGSVLIEMQSQREPYVTKFIRYDPIADRVRIIE